MILFSCYKDLSFLMLWDDNLSLRPSEKGSQWLLSICNKDREWCVCIPRSLSLLMYIIPYFVNIVWALRQLKTISAISLQSCRDVIGVINLYNQLSYLFRYWRIQGIKTEIHEFRGPKFFRDSRSGLRLLTFLLESKRPSNTPMCDVIRFITNTKK